MMGGSTGVKAAHCWAQKISWSRRTELVSTAIDRD